MGVFLGYSVIDARIDRDLAAVGHVVTTKSDNVYEYAGASTADDIVVLGNDFQYSGNRVVGGSPRQIIGLKQQDTVFTLRFFNTSIEDLVGLSQAQQLAKIFREDDYIRGYASAATNDVFRGYDGNDDIDGALGADKMYGGKGNDRFTVSQAGDKAFEAAGEGTDLVVASVSYSLAGQAIENLALLGKGRIDGSGNELSNFIIGNKADNVLDGGAGNDILNAGNGNDRLVGGLGVDRMVGGSGNDSYVVDSLKDNVVEIRNHGIDRIEASLDYTLKANVENLRLTGKDDLSGTGNTLDNAITGNAGDNILNGKLGSDRLIGSSGNDSFVFDTALGAGNVDHVKDFSVLHDEIHLAKSVFPRIASGTLDAGAFREVGSAPLDADDRILYNRKTGALSYDADGSGAEQAIQFAVLDTHPNLSAHDIIIV